MKIPMVMKYLIQKERPSAWAENVLQQIGLLFETVLIYVGNTPPHLSLYHKESKMHPQRVYSRQVKLTNEPSDPVRSDVY